HITPQVDQILKKSGIVEGMMLVSAMHITAGIYVNDNESGLIADIDQWLETLAPFRKDYQHHQTGEDNGDSHLKALLIHHEVIVPVTAGKLDPGTRQRIFYGEFDGQRDKRVIVKVMGELPTDEARHDSSKNAARALNSICSIRSVRPQALAATTHHPGVARQRSPPVQRRCRRPAMASSLLPAPRLQLR